MRRLTAMLTVLALTLGASITEAQTGAPRLLTVDAARAALAAGAAEARRGQAGGAIAVVDDGGHLIALERLDGTFAAAAQVATGKARTAALFRRPTKAFEEAVNRGRTAMVALADFTPLQGGVPIVVEERVVGAVGVSGARSAEHDEEIAQVAARAAQAMVASAAAHGTSTRAITHFAADRVAAAFARGAPLLEVDGYKIHASRRDAPGIAEIHDWETDVIYVLEGAATFVTGGEVVEPTVTEPGQIRGAEIRYGVARRLAPGDVIVVPPGVPHWFKEVQAPFLYFVVKPISNGGGR